MNRELRKALCSPPITTPSGDINPLYFQSAPGQYWSEDDQEGLLRGIKQFGVGRDSQIRERFLPHKTVEEIHLRTCLLVGAHDLTAALGVKSKARLEAMYDDNKSRAEAEGLWRFGVYLNKARPSE